MTVVVNHLHFSDPLVDDTMQACRDVVQRIVEAGATAAQVARIDDTHLVLILEFASVADADRVAQEVGGPWMRERIQPQLARGAEPNVGEVKATASAPK